MQRIPIKLLQNFVNDYFPTMALALLSAHIKLLGIRVSQIGYATRSPEANEAELLYCIKDQEQLYKWVELKAVENLKVGKRKNGSEISIFEQVLS